VVKCSVCKGKIEYTFLQKPIGTWIRDKKGKKHVVCSHCQKQFSVDELREKL